MIIFMSKGFIEALNIIFRYFFIKVKSQRLFYINSATLRLLYTEVTKGKVLLSSYTVILLRKEMSKNMEKGN